MSKSVQRRIECVKLIADDKLELGKKGRARYEMSVAGRSAWHSPLVKTQKGEMSICQEGGRVLKPDRRN